MLSPTPSAFIATPLPLRAFPTSLPSSAPRRHAVSHPAPPAALLVPPPHPAPQAPASPPPVAPGGGPKRRRVTGSKGPQYYANVGAAITAIRADYPELLEREPDMSIFTDDVVLKDRVSLVRGKEAYSRCLWAIRFHAKLVFREAQVCIVSMFHDEKEGTLNVRWRLTGAARILSRFENKPWIYDGMSQYRFDLDGFIIEHDLDSTVRNKPRQQLTPLFEKVLSVNALKVPGGVSTGCGFDAQMWKAAIEALEEAAGREDARWEESSQEGKTCM